jgi:hypothetical protein
MADRHLGREGFRVRRVRRNINDLTGHIDLPAVEDAAQPTLFVASQSQRSAPVRAPFVKEAHPAVGRSKGDKIPPEETDPQGNAVRNDLGGQQGGDPVVLPHQVPHGGITFDLGQHVILFTREHDTNPLFVAVSMPRQH